MHHLSIQDIRNIEPPSQRIRILQQEIEQAQRRLESLNALSRELNAFQANLNWRDPQNI